jgi:excisionase family DNA binding protein
MEKLKDKLFFTTAEVASLLKVSRVTIFQKIKSGSLEAKKFGRNYLIPREEIEQLVVNKGKLTENEKKEIKESIDRSIKEYGEAIRMLGRE